MGFDEDDVQSAARRIEGDAAPGDATADDQDVRHMPGVQPVQVTCPSTCVEIGGGDGHGASLPGRAVTHCGRARR